MNTLAATKPARSTAHRGCCAVPTHIHWVFPFNKTSAITAGHVIGRDVSCDTVLPGQEISRQHARLEEDGPLRTIVDLGSRNGTSINGVRSHKAPLTEHDIVRCGEWVGVVATCEQSRSFGEIAPGWFGGAVLFRAVEPVTRLSSSLPVVIQGETGTGKEGAAQAIHRWSGRKGSLLAINCAALPEHLAEAELFGYRKGAFSGADSPAPGLFRAANGGTLFLDEVIDLPKALQAKLLRVLEQKEVLPLGETRPVPVDVRIVTASQSPLSDAVSKGHFRADLHARLDGLTIVLPPLRERREDILPLAIEFVRRFAQGREINMEAGFAEALCVHHWPMNVRELSMLMRRLTEVHGHEPALRKSHLPRSMLERSVIAPEPSIAPRAKREWQRTDDEEQLQALAAALRENAGNVARAAAAIGIHRARAYRLLAARPDLAKDIRRT